MLCKLFWFNSGTGHVLLKPKMPPNFFLDTGMFYFHLGNIHPKYRSKLSSIQLLGIVKSKHISEYGIDSILDPFVADVKKLVSLLQ